MGRFKGKSSSEAKAKRDFVRINPYEIPEKALAVIANICSKNNTDDANPIIQALESELEKKGRNGLDFYEFIEKYRKDFYNIDFLADIRKQLSEIVQELLAHENTKHTQVVVAGGFSAGKSSFLNALTGAGDLLPTGIDPCSMVQTYLYCSGSAETTEIRVKAVNLKNAVVLLDKDVLQSIQHESKSKVYLASVLDKLFVEVPSKELDGFVFIDTPGYNNSEKKNATNNSTDEETAKDAINRGNVLLWVIDAGGGTIPKKDKEMIHDFVQQAEDRKIAVVFNKADKKGEEEIRKIVRDAYLSLSDIEEAVIDVFGFSSQENRMYYSYRGYDMSKLLDQLKNSGNGNSGVERCKEAILELFDDEIDFANDVIEADEKEKKVLIDRKNDTYKWINNEKDGTKDILEWLKGVSIDTYSLIYKAMEQYASLTIDVLSDMNEKLGSIYEDENSKRCSHDSVLGELSRGLDLIDKYLKRYDKIDYKFYDEANRKELVETIKAQLNRLDDILAKDYDGIEGQLDTKNIEIQKFKIIANEMKKYRDIVRSTLDYKVSEFSSNKNKEQGQDARLDFTQTSDIFTSIRLGSYSDFLNCFVAGVKLSQTNPEGYSPLTYAVKMNKNDMVKFLLENDARPELSDARGMNAFLTAVENANGPLVEHFLKLDLSLAASCSEKGESAMEIAEKNALGEWYKSKI